MSQVVATHQPPAPQRWLGAPQADTTRLVGLQAEVGTLREVDLRRVVNQHTQQQVERAASQRYRVHGLLTPLSLLGRGPAQWNQLTDLLVQTPGADGAAADFFRDFSYELLVPTRAEALPGLPNYYQLYYEALPQVNVEVLAGTLSRDAWGGAHYPFTLTQPLDVAGRFIAGLPVPLPVTEVAVRLLGPADTKRYAWPASWKGGEQAPAPGSATGFRQSDVLVRRPEVVAWLLEALKPRGWAGVSDGWYVEKMLGQLVPLWAAYDLAFSRANLEANTTFVLAQLELVGYTHALVALEPRGKEVVGPRVRFDPAQGELTYESWPHYAYAQSMRVADTPANRDLVSLLGYAFHPESAGTLLLRFNFQWSAFSRLPLRELSPFIERVPRVGTDGQPAWAYLDPVSDEWVYRDLLDPGVTQLTRGVNFPFLNNAHYVYARIAHYVAPDLSFYNAFRAFSRVLPAGRFVETLLTPDSLLF